VDGAGLVTADRFQFNLDKTILATAHLTFTISSGLDVFGGTVTNNGTITSTLNIKGGGGGTLVNGTSATLNIAGNMTVGTLTATATGNTVDYNGSRAQVLKGTT